MKKETSKKHDDAWGMKSGDLLLPYSIRSTRKQAIADMCEHAEVDDYQHLKRCGYSFVKLSIQEKI